ncbi:MAG: adenosylcobinamide-GDP ribazoletransferase [Frankiales bacterium]|nr:adenosylcobinamide-GDP ribazoletransferase [Frankiales bacterium]
MPDGLRLALTTFTVAPLHGPRQLDRRTARTAVELAPLVGLLLGLVAAGVLAGSRALTDSPPLLPAALAVGSLALLTRGLHLDGLADLADGLGSYRDPEGTRAVMKAPDVGPMGIATLVVTLLVQVAAVLTCTVHGRGPVSLGLAVVTGRLAVLWACTGTPAATAEGLGALVAQTARRPVAVAWTVVTAAAFAWYATVDGGSYPLLRTVLAVVVGLGLAWLVRRHATRRVGGLTGDVLGALTELATTACLVVLAAAW